MANSANQDALASYGRRRRALKRRQTHQGNGPEGKKGMPFWAGALIIIGVLSVIGVGVGGVAALTIYHNYADKLVAPDELAINQPSYGARIYDRNGTLLYEYVDDKSGLRRPVKIADVSPAFLAATIATEDNSFFTNPGINIPGLARAALENAGIGGSGVFEGSGGSSITQQLVKNVYIPEEERQQRSISRKIKEVVYSLELTKDYSKSQILEWYVNQISYGGVYNGVEAAAEGYFGVHAKDLTLAEATTLAGIPQSPAAYDPNSHPEASKQRRNEVLDLMERQGRIQIGENTFYQVNPAEVAAARTATVQAGEHSFQILAPHFVLNYIEPQLRTMLGCPQIADLQKEVIAGTHSPLIGRPGEGCSALYTRGLVVTTTLDLNLQNQTQQIMESQIEKYEAQSGSHNGAMMIMDPKTGQILVMIGSRDYFNAEILGKNNNATACNSPGSSFKPFAYITAFKDLGWGPGTMILDAPVTYPGGPGAPPFVPSNPEHDFSGPVTVRFSLGNSLNIPADKAAAAVGPQNIVIEARKLGFVESFRVDGCAAAASGYGPAIATGGVGVTLDEMMYGYSTLANGGQMRGQEPLKPHDADERQIDPVSILKVTDNKNETLWDYNQKKKQAQVIDPGYTYLIWSILTDGQAECKTFGCSGIQIPGYTAGVKTGTSQPYNDDDPVCGGKIGETWAFGYSPDLVVGIWAGNSDNSCVHNLFSSDLAYHAMANAFINAEKSLDIKPTPMVKPDDVVQGTVCVPSGLKPTALCGKTSTDLFVKKDLPTQDDTWWQQVSIDIRNGKLAAPNTPPQLVQKQTMLMVPQNLQQTDSDKQAWAGWAKALGIQLAPTEVSDGQFAPGSPGSVDANSPAIIFSPQPNTKLTGVTPIVGRAFSDNITGYRLEYGQGANPTSWTQILTAPFSVQGGTIGVWDVTNVDPGVYTLRLVVQDSKKGELTYPVVVSVNQDPPAATVTPSPTSTPTTVGPH